MVGVEGATTGSRGWLPLLNRCAPCSLTCEKRGPPQRDLDLVQTNSLLALRRVPYQQHKALSCTGYSAVRLP